MIDWRLRGPEITNCNCAWGCPCQFNSLPTNGNCRAVVAMQIDEGHFGDVDLTGRRFATLVEWPGPIHHGNGQVLPIVRAPESLEFYGKPIQNSDGQWRNDMRAVGLAVDEIKREFVRGLAGIDDALQAFGNKLAEIRQLAFAA